MDLNSIEGVMAEILKNAPKSGDSDSQTTSTLLRLIGEHIEDAYEAYSSGSYYDAAEDFRCAIAFCDFVRERCHEMRTFCKFAAYRRFGGDAQ